MSNDNWNSADAYERFMGRWSRNLARHFVEWLKVPGGSNWLEIGCGTGALTRAICESAEPSSVTAVDTSAEFVAYCAANLQYPCLQVIHATAETLPVRQGGYDAVVSSLVLNFLPDPVKSLQDMQAVSAPNGCVAACVWDYSEGMEFLRLFWDASITINPGAVTYDEAARFPLCKPDALQSAFEKAGFAHLDLTSLTVPTVFADFEDYWASLSHGTGPAPSYCASLSAAERETLARELRKRTRSRGDAITLNARAWAVKGRSA
jgi:ubiquinone/menaquinone biosynthesis C-methylase UbiE